MIPPPLILLVDDEEPMREVFSAYLVRAGYQVLEAPNGLEALQTAKSHSPDLVISDVLMPGMDGYEFVRALRREPILSTIPVILFSGIFIERSALELAKNLGIRPFLTKPITRDMFLESVASALRSTNRLPLDSPDQLDRDHHRILVDKLNSTVKELALDIAERKRIEQVLDERLRFESLLTELSATFAKLPAIEVDQEIDKWLKTLVEFLNLDRATFFHLGEDRITVRRGHSYAAPGIEPLPLSAMNEEFPWVALQLRLGNTIKWSHVLDDIPDEAEKEKAYAIKFGVKSGLNIPVSIGGSVICAISFTSLRAHRNWPDDLVARLRLVGEIFANAIARKKAEMALRQNEAALLDASRRLMRAEDGERRRIAKELHDSTVQDLVAVMMNLETLRESAPLRDSPEGKNLEDGLALLENCAHEIRTLSYVLHPPRLDEAGLTGAIQHYAGGFAERTGIAMSLDLPVGLGRLGEMTEMVLFRVVQESLGNIHRHSLSRAAFVRVQQSAFETVLEIRDEGRGIRTLETNREQGTKLGVGISGMRERLRQIGGKLDIISDSSGTVVRATVPVSGGSS